MSRPMADTPQRRPRRPRRRYDEEFKAQAVRLVLDEGKSLGRGVGAPVAPVRRR